jgi:hypothetical protein
MESGLAILARERGRGARLQGASIPWLDGNKTLAPRRGGQGKPPNFVTFVIEIAALELVHPAVAMSGAAIEMVDRGLGRSYRWSWKERWRW